MTKEELVNTISDIEWKMFQDVPNIGGKAACQEDQRTFKIMRQSQSASWSTEMLESYLDDLTLVEQNGKNLITEKYARMMESTSPAEFARIRHTLPPLSPAAVTLIDDIMKIILQWEEELLKKYPHILGTGRPIYRSGDTPFETSLETYLRSELATYSLKTLERYYENILRQNSEGDNAAAVTLEYTVKQYGYKSLEEAEAVLRNRVK